ncbi:hypothetical protein Vafri_17854 [Volvox africanus]|uniref:PUM-HD domain-containing protein n=1 Tax=Volvox africanus TaxID=51714 RepID=A0A8J4BN33_9CHLO|nr:hypothetical protein Vafri_17854 [Volvox africanus]
MALVNTRAASAAVRVYDTHSISRSNSSGSGNGMKTGSGGSTGGTEAGGLRQDVDNCTVPCNGQTPVAAAEATAGFSPVVVHPAVCSSSIDSAYSVVSSLASHAQDLARAASSCGGGGGGGGGCDVGGGDGGGDNGDGGIRKVERTPVDGDLASAPLLTGAASSSASSRFPGAAVPLAAAATLLPPSQYQRYCARMCEAHAQAMAELASSSSSTRVKYGNTDDGDGAVDAAQRNASDSDLWLAAVSAANNTAGDGGISQMSPLPPPPPPPPPRPGGGAGGHHQRTHGGGGQCWTSLDEWRQRNLLEIEATEGLVPGYQRSPPPPSYNHVQRHRWYDAAAPAPLPPPLTGLRQSLSAGRNPYFTAASAGGGGSGGDVFAPPLPVRTPASPPSSGGSGLSPAGKMLYRFLSQRATGGNGNGIGGGGNVVGTGEGYNGGVGGIGCNGNGGGDADDGNALTKADAFAFSQMTAFRDADGTAVLESSPTAGSASPPPPPPPAATAAAMAAAADFGAGDSGDFWFGNPYVHGSDMYGTYKHRSPSPPVNKAHEGTDLSSPSYFPQLGFREGHFDVPQGLGSLPSLDGLGMPYGAQLHFQMYGGSNAFGSLNSNAPASPPLYCGSIGDRGGRGGGGGYIPSDYGGGGSSGGGRSIGGGNCIRLESLFGRLVSLSCDQQGSRVVQRLLCAAQSEQVGRCLDELLPCVTEVACHPYGNYVLQQLMTVGGSRHKLRLCGALAGRILELSFDPYGCRVVQKLLEVVPEQQAAAAVAELDGAVMRCVRDKCAHHVLRAALHHVPHHRQAFLVDGLQAALPSLARHPYGCRLVQSLLQTVSEPERWRFIGWDLLQDAPQLGGHEYGNYVMQTLAQVAAPEVRSALVLALAPHAVRLACCRHGSPVLEAVLKYGSESDREVLLNALLGAPLPGSGGSGGGGGVSMLGRTARGPSGSSGSSGGDVFPPLTVTGGGGSSANVNVISRALRLACDPFGNYVLQRCFQVCSPAQQERVAAALVPTIPELMGRCAASHHPGMAALLARLQEITADPSVRMQAEPPPLPPPPPPPPPPHPSAASRDAATSPGALSATAMTAATVTAAAAATVGPFLKAAASKASNSAATTAIWEPPPMGGGGGGGGGDIASPRSILRAVLSVGNSSLGSSYTTNHVGGGMVSGGSASSSAGGSGSQCAAAVATATAAAVVSGPLVSSDSMMVAITGKARPQADGLTDDADSMAAAAVAVAAAARALSLEEWALLAAAGGDSCAPMRGNSGGGGDGKHALAGQGDNTGFLQTAQLSYVSVSDSVISRTARGLEDGAEEGNGGGDGGACDAAATAVAAAATTAPTNRDQEVAAGRLLLRTLSRVTSGGNSTSLGGGGGSSAAVTTVPEAAEDAVLSDDNVIAVLRVLGLAPVGSGRRVQPR